MNLNNKIKLVYYLKGPLLTDWLIDLTTFYFDVSCFDPTVTYDKKSTIFYVNLFDENLQVVEKLTNEGYAVVVDGLWEIEGLVDMVFKKNNLNIQNPSKVLMLSNSNWGWYDGCLESRYFGKDKYVPNRTYHKTAFMPMRNMNVYRKFLHQALLNHLNDFIWSFVAMGVKLPDGTGTTKVDLSIDIEQALPQTVGITTFNPEWYDNTCFSLVAETVVPSALKKNLKLSEKTWKPIIHQHPFMILGTPGLLQYLKSQGFETFENMFDESYDEPGKSLVERVNIIKQNVDSYKKQPHSPLTLNKIQHNHYHFFDQDLVKNRIVEEVFSLILEHAEA